MNPINTIDEDPGLDGPDYVAVVIDWDAIGDEEPTILPSYEPDKRVAKIIAVAHTAPAPSETTVWRPEDLAARDRPRNVKRIAISVVASVAAIATLFALATSLRRRWLA